MPPGSYHKPPPTPSDPPTACSFGSLVLSSTPWGIGPLALLHHTCGLSLPNHLRAAQNLGLKTFLFREAFSSTHYQLTITSHVFNLYKTRKCKHSKLWCYRGSCDYFLGGHCDFLEFCHSEVARLPVEIPGHHCIWQEIVQHTNFHKTTSLYFLHLCFCKHCQ